MSKSPIDAQTLAALDDKLSKRFIELDPKGYFLISVDREQGLICAQHFPNTINDKGLACDPDTGEPITRRTPTTQTVTTIYSGRTAKELFTKLFEETENCPVTYLDHAAYLGREFTRAEQALINNTEYIQD